MRWLQIVVTSNTSDFSTFSSEQMSLETPNVIRACLSFRHMVDGYFLHCCFLQVFSRISVL